MRHLLCAVIVAAAAPAYADSLQLAPMTFSLDGKPQLKLLADGTVIDASDAKPVELGKLTAGGVFDGRGLRATVKLGADGVLHLEAGPEVQLGGVPVKVTGPTAVLSDKVVTVGADGTVTVKDPASGKAPFTMKVTGATSPELQHTAAFLVAHTTWRWAREKAPKPLDKDGIRKGIKLNLNKIQYCYEKRLLAVPTLAGTIDTSFKILVDGTVAPGKASGFDQEIADCVLGVVAGIDYPATDRPTLVNYPFTFSNADPKKK